jgi:hypothetical protein
VEKERDPVRYLLDWLLANESCISEELALRAELATREVYGGFKVRIWKRPNGRPGRPRGTDFDAAQVYADGLTSRSTDEIVAQHGVSRRTLYRMLKKGPPAKT